jgi:hypothetical protein
VADVTGEYLVSPETGKTVLIPAENAAAAKADGFLPASDQQIRSFQADVEAIKSPVLSTLKTGAIVAGELAAAPVSIARTMLGLGEEEFAKRAEGDRMQRETMALIKGKPVAPPTAAEETARSRAEVLARAGEYLEPLTPTGALIRSGLQTREQIQAAQEEAGLTGQVLGLAGAVLAPGALARTALSGAAKGAAALALEEKAAESAARAARLTAEGASGAAAAIKASEEAAKRLASAVDAAAARRALLAKVPGGEKIARGVERALALPGETAGLKLISEAAGSPVAQAAERSAASLIEKTPVLSKAPPIIKELVAKSVAQGAGSAADMALLGLAQTSQESILGDHKITTERALANMKNGAIEGFNLGLTLGGVPTAMSGALKGISTATRALDRTFNRYFPGIAAAVTGADVQSVEALRRARGEIANVGELIEQDMAARRPLPVEPPSFVPGVTPAPFVGEKPRMVGVEGVGMVPEVKAPGMGEITPLEPLPRPEAPVKPTPIQVQPPKLTPVETEKVAHDFLTDLRSADQSAQTVMYELNKFIRPEEEVRLFENWRKWQQDKVISEATRSLGGRPPTLADMKAFERARDAIDDLVYDESLRLSSHIRGIVSGVLDQFPDAVPTGTLKSMLHLANKLEAVARKEVPVTRTYKTINSVKRQLFDLAPAFEQGETVTQIEAKARQAARNAGLELMRATEKEAIWGPNAVRAQKVNDARTRFTLANKNVKRLLGRKEDIGIDASSREFASNKIASFVEDPASVANADKLDAVSEWRASLSDLEREARESALNYAGKTNLEQFSKHIGTLGETYTMVENTAIRKIDMEFAKQEAARIKAETKAFNDELNAEFQQRKAQFEAKQAEIDAAEEARQVAHDELQTRVEQLEGERKLRAQVELDRLREENKVASQRAKQRRKEFDDKQKAAEEEAKARRAEFDRVMKERKAEVSEQVKLLQKGAKLNDLGGAVLAYEMFSHPVLAPIVAAAKNPAMTYKVLDKLERAARATEAKARAVVDYIGTNDRSILSSLEPAFMPKTAKQEREEYEERVKKLQKVVNDNNEMMLHLDRGVEETNQHAPKISDHARQVQTQAVLSLAGAIPQPPLNLPPYRRATWQPNDAQIRKFNRTYDAVANPTGVMRNMALGTATQDEINMVNNIYGSLMDDLKAKVIDKLKANSDMPAADRAKLSKLMGLDVDGAPALGASAQAVYSQQSPQPSAGQQQMKIGQAKGLSLSGRESQETAAWRAAQPQGAAARAMGAGAKF